MFPSLMKWRPPVDKRSAGVRILTDNFMEDAHMVLRRIFASLTLISALMLTGTSIQAAEGHALHVQAELVAKDGQLTFVSPAGTPMTIPADSVRGKPYIISIFHAGFSPGNDAPIDYHWGTVGDDLGYGFTTPAHYENGPYDAVLIVYVNTPITEAIKQGDPLDVPPPVKGDLCSFTIDDSVVEANDPSIPNGLVRLNVHDQDASITISNRPILGSSTDDLVKALSNTVMILP
jgi:hypothetical protein